MSDELKAAANRFTGYDLGDFQGPTGGDADVRASIALSRYVLADLAAREAEERERALPIDREWLLSIGFTGSIFSGPANLIKSSGRLHVTIRADQIRLFDNADTSIVIGRIDSMTRGDLLDLLAGLKIPTKGGAA